MLIIALAMGCLVLGFFLNFSFEKKVETFVEEQLKKKRPLPHKVR